MLIGASEPSQACIDRRAGGYRVAATARWEEEAPSSRSNSRPLGSSPDTANAAIGDADAGRVAVLMVKSNFIASNVYMTKYRLAVYRTGAPSGSSRRSPPDAVDVRPVRSSPGNGIELVHSYEFEVDIRDANSNVGVVWSPSGNALCIWVGSDVRVVAPVAPSSPLLHPSPPAPSASKVPSTSSSSDPSTNPGGRGAAGRLVLVASASVPNAACVASSYGTLIVGMKASVAVYTWNLKFIRFIAIGSLPVQELSKHETGGHSLDVEFRLSDEKTAHDPNYTDDLAVDAWESPFKICSSNSSTVDTYGGSPSVSAVVSRRGFALLVGSCEVAPAPPVTATSSGSSGTDSSGIASRMSTSEFRFCVPGDSTILDVAIVERFDLPSQTSPLSKEFSLFLLLRNDAASALSIVECTVGFNEVDFCLGVIRYTNVFCLNHLSSHRSSQLKLLIASVRLDRHIFVVDNAEVACVAYARSSPNKFTSRTVVRQSLFSINVSRHDALFEMGVLFLPQSMSLFVAHSECFLDMKEPFVCASVYPLMMSLTTRPDGALINQPLVQVSSGIFYLPRARNIGGHSQSKQRKCAAINTLRPDASQDVGPIACLSRSHSSFSEILANEASEISESFVSVRAPTFFMSVRHKSLVAALDDSNNYLGAVLVASNGVALWIHSIASGKSKCIDLCGHHITFSDDCVSNREVDSVKCIRWFGSDSIALVTVRGGALCFELMSLQSSTRESSGSSAHGKAARFHIAETHVCHVLRRNINSSETGSFSFDVDMCKCGNSDRSMIAAIYGDRDIWLVNVVLVERKTNGHKLPLGLWAHATPRQRPGSIESTAAHLVHHFSYSIQNVKHCDLNASRVTDDSFKSLLPTTISKLVIQPTTVDGAPDRSLDLVYLVVMDCAKNLFRLHFDQERQVYVASKLAIESSLYDIFPFYRCFKFKSRAKRLISRDVAIITRHHSSNFGLPSLRIDSNFGISLLPMGSNIKYGKARESCEHESSNYGCFPLFLYLEPSKMFENELEHLSFAVLRTGDRDRFRASIDEFEDASSTRHAFLAPNFNNYEHLSSPTMVSERFSLAACGIFQILSDFLGVDASKLPSSFIVEYERQLFGLQATVRHLHRSPVSVASFINSCESYLHALIEGAFATASTEIRPFAMRNMLDDNVSLLYFTFLGVLGVIDQYLSIEVVTRCARKLEPSHRRVMFPLPVVGGRLVNRMHPSAPFIIGFEETELFDFCVHHGFVNHAMRMLPIAIDACLNSSTPSPLNVHELLSQSLICSKQVMHSCAIHVRLTRFLPELVAFMTRVHAEFDIQSHLQDSGIETANESSRSFVWNSIDWIMSVFSQPDVTDSDSGSEANVTPGGVLSLDPPGMVLHILGSVIQQLFYGFKTLGCAYIALSIPIYLPPSCLTDTIARSVEESLNFYTANDSNLLNWTSDNGHIADLLLRNPRSWSEATQVIVSSMFQMFDPSETSLLEIYNDSTGRVCKHIEAVRDSWRLALPQHLLDLLYEAELVPASRQRVALGAESTILAEENGFNAYKGLDRPLRSVHTVLVELCPSRSYLSAFESRHSALSMEMSAKDFLYDKNSPIFLFAAVTFASLIPDWSHATDGISDKNGTDLPLILLAIFSKLIASEEFYVAFDQIGASAASRDSNTSLKLVELFCSYLTMR